MLVLSPGWLTVLALVALGAFLLPSSLKRLSLRRIQRLKRRDDLFDDIADPDSENTEDQSKQAQKRVRLFHQGLKRTLIFALVLSLSLALAFPYFATLPAALVSFFLGALTLIFGTAAKPAIENFISGIVLAFSQTINIGDTILVDDEHYGTIEDLGYTHCVVKIWDWRRYVIPNTTMLQKSFLNYSLRDQFVLAYVSFSVAPDSDLDLVEKLCQKIPKESKYFAPYEEPALWVMEMEKDSITCWCGAWADSPSDAWMLKSDIRQGLLKAFRENGIITHAFHLKHDASQMEEIQKVVAKKT